MTVHQQIELNKKHRRVSLAILSFGLFMLGVSFAAVPLYDLFCRVTGFGGTTQQVEMNNTASIAVPMNVRFDANVAKGFPWKFKPVEREVKVNLGESITIEYEATNLSNRPLTGTATFNVTPQSAGAYFNKIECFCFVEQTLEAGETVRMPVNFFVDPEILEDHDANWIKTITLSYSFSSIDE